MNYITHVNNLIRDHVARHSPLVMFKKKHRGGKLYQRIDSRNKERRWPACPEYTELREYAGRHRLWIDAEWRQFHLLHETAGLSDVGH